MRAQVRETVGYPYLQGDSDPLELRVVPGRAKAPARHARAKGRCAKAKHSKGRRGKSHCRHSHLKRR